MHEITNEHIHVAWQEGLSQRLRDANVLSGDRVVLGPVDLVAEGRSGRWITARIEPRKPEVADVFGPRIAGFASCAELLVRAARSGALTLRRASAGGDERWVPCSGARLDPHRGLVAVDVPGDCFVAGELITGALEVDGRRYELTTSVAATSPPSLYTPERLEEVPAGPDDGPAWAEIVSSLRAASVRRRLLDLAATRLVFNFDPTIELFPPGLRLPEVVLHLDGDVLRAPGRVCAVRRTGRHVAHCVVGIATRARDRVRLVAWMARSSRQEPAASDQPTIEAIDEPSRVLGTLESLLRSPHVSAVLHGDDGARRNIAPPRVEAAGLRWAAPPPRGTLEIARCASVYTFAVPSAGGEDPSATALPDSLLRVRQRWYRRVRPAAGDGVRFGRRPVADLSYDGFSFGVDLRAERLEPGARVRDVVRDAAGRRVRVEAHVLAVERPAGVAGVAGGRSVAHARVLPRTALDRAAWTALVDARLHPTTRTGDRWSDALWSLYERAGYFALSGKTPAQFTSLKRSFEQVASRLARASHLGGHVVYPSEALGAAGALSVLKVYSRSWLGFQMAKVRGDTPEGVPGRAVLRDLHLHAYEHVQRDPELAWVIGYLQVKPVWSRLVHHDLPERYVASGRAYIVRFQAIELAAGGGSPDPDVGLASSSETALLLTTLGRTRPRAYLEALDLTPARYDLSASREAWAAAGLSRDRATLVVRRRGLPVAAAILELGEDGAHLFRLLDLVRIVPLARGAAQHTGRLLAQAARWFAERRKPSFILFREEGTSVDLSGARIVQDMGFADMSILSAAHLPELLERVCEVTSLPDAPSAAAPVAAGAGARGGSARG